MLHKEAKFLLINSAGPIWGYGQLKKVLASGFFTLTYLQYLLIFLLLYNFFFADNKNSNKA